LKHQLSKTQRLSYTALFLALSLVLPLAFHAFGVAGRIFLPMHIPVLLAGMLVGPFSALVVGLLGPGLSHLMTGMPPTYAVPLMTLELPVYGVIAGVLYYRLKLHVYLSLIVAMVAGRLVFGLALLVLGMFMNLPYTAATFFSAGGAVVAGLPGVVLQLALIPLLVTAVKRRTR